MPKEYIERDVLLTDINESVVFSSRADYTSTEMRGANKVISRIKEAPAADVVEVVRCKRCAHAHKLTQSEERLYTNDCIMCTRIHPDGVRIPMLLDDFCSYGERKDNNI